MPTGIAVVTLIAVVSTAQPADPLRITPAEKAACAEDAERLCASAYPDEHRLIACMIANRSTLSARCVTALDDGVKRRGL